MKKKYFRIESGRVNSRNFSCKPYGFWRPSLKQALKVAISWHKFDIKYRQDELKKMEKMLAKESVK